MKTVIISDCHGRIMWKRIIRKEEPDQVIFLGDYWDSFNITFLEQLQNFKDIIQYKKDNPETILLVGNHDFSYWPGVTERCSGYQHEKAFLIKEEFYEHELLFQLAYRQDKFLFTHAGVSDTFMNNAVGIDGWQVDEADQVLNDLWKHKAQTFGFYSEGWSMYGDDPEQGPLWIRPKSLMRSSQRLKKAGYIQVVGHTAVDKIDIKGRSTGGKFFFTDTQETSKEYLIIIDNKVSLGKI